MKDLGRLLTGLISVEYVLIASSYLKVSNIHDTLEV